MKSITAIARLANIDKAQLFRLVHQGRVVGAQMVAGKWLAPEPLTIIQDSRAFAPRAGVLYVGSPKMPPLPNGQFRCHVIDPPWPIAKISRKVRPNQVAMDYTVMTVPEITRLAVPAKTDHAGAHLYLWVTHRFLPDALAMVKEWGYRYQCLMTWVKNGGITPYSWQYNTEHVVFATTGDLALNRLGLKLSFNGDRREHSRKPESFYELVMKASPGPRMEWFGRQRREGFVVWGNETEHFNEIQDSI